MDIYEQWLKAFESIGTPAISTDTAAKILAVTYVHGGANSDFVYNEKLGQDLRHIQRLYGVSGGEAPNIDIVEGVKKYTNDLENYRDKWQNTDDEEDTGDFRMKVPQWAYDLFKSRYNINLIRIKETTKK